MSDLPTCPFCGGEAKLQDDKVHHYCPVIETLIECRKYEWASRAKHTCKVESTIAITYNGRVIYGNRLTCGHCSLSFGKHTDYCPVCAAKVIEK